MTYLGILQALRKEYLFIAQDECKFWWAICREGRAFSHLVYQLYDKDQYFLRQNKMYGGKQQWGVFEI